MSQCKAVFPLIPHQGDHNVARTCCTTVLEKKNPREMAAFNLVASSLNYDLGALLALIAVESSFVAVFHLSSSAHLMNLHTPIPIFSKGLLFLILVLNLAGAGLLRAAPEIGIEQPAGTPLGHVVAWGDDFSGQTAVPGGLVGVKAVSAGWQHSLALKSDGTVVAWGDNTVGQSTVRHSGRCHSHLGGRRA